MILEKNIPVAQEMSSLTSLGPFLVFDTLVVVVRKGEVAAIECFVVTIGGGDMVRWVWCVWLVLVLAIVVIVQVGASVVIVS